MRLYHYSAEPFTFDPSRTYTHGSDLMKPSGLWLSAETDDEDSHGWKDWCEGEEFNLNGLTHRTEMAFGDGANILRIETAEALDIFTHSYRLRNTPYDSLRAIDWRRVTNKYQGILIAPYQWERRHDLHTFWYYPWDCASACVWDISVLSIRIDTAEYAVVG